MKKKVYITGNISNNPNYKEQFKKAEETLNANGCIVMNPAILPDGFSQEDYMTLYISMINVCDIVVFLNGWDESFEAEVEHLYCEKAGKLIYYEEDIEFIRGK